MPQTLTSYAQKLESRPALTFAVGGCATFAVLIWESVFLGAGIGSDGVNCLVLAICFGFLLTGFACKQVDPTVRRIPEKLALALVCTLSITCAMMAFGSLLESMWTNPVLTVSLVGGAIACLYQAGLGAIILAFYLARKLPASGSSNR